MQKEYTLTESNMFEEIAELRQEFDRLRRSSNNPKLNAQTKYPMFPFLNSDIPRHLFCFAIDKEFLYACLMSDCFGQEIVELDNLEDDLKKWEYCDSKYFIPFYDKIRSSFNHRPVGFFQNFLIRSIHNMKTEILETIETTSRESEQSLSLMTTILDKFKNLEIQLSSLDEIIQTSVHKTHRHTHDQ